MSRILIWSLTAALATIAFIYLGRKIDWTVLFDLSLFQAGLLFFSTFLLICLHAMGAAALLKGLGYSAGPVRVLVSMLATSTVSLAGDPKLGVPARLFFYKFFAGVPFSIGAAQTAIESLLWLVMMGFLITIPGPLAGDYTLPLSLTAAGFVCGGIAVIAVGPGLVDRLWLVGPLFRRMSRLRSFILDVRSSILTIRPFSLALASVWFGATYIIDILTVSFLAQVLGASISWIAIGHAIVISYLIGAVSLLPLGLGVRDVTFVVLLQQAGLSAEQAATVALIHRIVRTALPLACGAIVTPIAIGIKRRLSACPN